jgi:hypothetical protein
MRINFEKYQAAEDKLHGLTATKELQRDRVEDLRRTLVLTEQAVRRGLAFGISSGALAELNISRRDSESFIACLKSDPARVLVLLQNHNDGVAGIVGGYVEVRNALNHAEKSLALTELEHGSLQTTVNRMRDFIRNFTNTANPLPRIVQ